MIRACDAAGDVGQWQQYLTPGTFALRGGALVSADASLAPQFWLASMGLVD